MENGGTGPDALPNDTNRPRFRSDFSEPENVSLPTPFSIAELNNHGSLFATRPKLNDYVGTRKELIEGADALFAAVISGTLHVPINHAYALKDAQKAHRDLEGRVTTGSGILKP